MTTDHHSPFARPRALLPSPLLSVLRLAVSLFAVSLLAVSLLSGGCARQDAVPQPRPLTDDELALLSVEGSVSKWLPIRFSAEIENGNESLTVTDVRLVVHGREIERAARIDPGESRRIAVQYLFPEDPDFGSIDPAAVEWELVGAVGVEGASQQDRPH